MKFCNCRRILDIYSQGLLNIILLPINIIIILINLSNVLMLFTIMIILLIITIVNIVILIIISYYYRPNICAVTCLSIKCWEN